MWICNKGLSVSDESNVSYSIKQHEPLIGLQLPIYRLGVWHAKYSLMLPVILLYHY